jgi:hypothetical protein
MIEAAGSDYEKFTLNLVYKNIFENVFKDEEPTEASNDPVVANELIKYVAGVMSGYRP